MTFLPLCDTIALPNAIKIYWDTLDVQIRRSLIRQLFAQKELFDKRTKIHMYDGWLAQKYNFRHKTIIEKSLEWRVEKVANLSESQPLIMHDICRHFLTKVCTATFHTIQTLGNGDQPEPAQNKYPVEWYLRVVEYLTTQVPPPLACMFMFAMFADCDGRDAAFANERYEALWQSHLAWFHERNAIPESTRTVPDILLPASPSEVTIAPVKKDPPRAIPPRPIPPPAPAKTLPVRVPLALPPPLVTIPSSFSALQHLVNRAIEDCCAQIKGALSNDAMRDALQELLRLNSNSLPYFYHVGYFQGLSATKFSTEKQQTQMAQAWAFLGFVMGCHRDNSDAVAGVIERNAPFWQLMLKNIPAGDVQVLYSVIPALIATRAYDTIADIMEHCPVPNLGHAEHPDSTAMVIYQVAAELVRNGTQLPQADRILQLLVAQLDLAGFKAISMGVVCVNVVNICGAKSNFIKQVSFFNRLL